MLKLITGIVLGFSAGTFAGLRINKFVSIMKVHKDLANQFNSKSSGAENFEVGIDAEDSTEA